MKNAFCLQQVAIPCINDHLLSLEDFESKGKLFRSVRSNGTEVFVVGKIWTTRSILVSEHFGKVSHPVK